MPGKAVGPLAKGDQIILRLNKLLAAPGGLSSFLSTFNYTLYLVAHLELKSAPLRNRLLALLGHENAPGVAVPAGPSPIAALASLLSQARTTIRLFSLLPMYAWARQLAQGPKPGQDPILYTTTVVQCTLYTLYQFMENVLYLVDSGVIPRSFLAKYTKDGKTADAYLFAYKAWCLGIACDFVKLAREAQLQRIKKARRTAAEAKDIDNYHADKEADARWWADLVGPMAWFPMGYHFAQWNEGGFPGFNLGVMGLCGGIAGWAKFKMLWDATASA